MEEAVVQKCQLVLELFRKTRGGQIDPPLSPLRVKMILVSSWTSCVCNGVVFRLKVLTGNQKIPPRGKWKGLCRERKFIAAISFF